MSVNYRVRNQQKGKYNHKGAACFYALAPGCYYSGGAYGYDSLARVIYPARLHGGYPNPKLDEATPMFLSFTMAVLRHADNDMRIRFLRQKRVVVFSIKPIPNQYKKTLMLLTWARYVEEKPHWVIGWYDACMAEKARTKRKVSLRKQFELFVKQHKGVTWDGHGLMTNIDPDNPITLQEFRKHYASGRDSVHAFFNKPTTQ